MSSIEACQSKVNGLMNKLRHAISPQNEQALDTLEDLEIALCDLETEVMRVDERSYEGIVLEPRKIA